MSLPEPTFRRVRLRVSGVQVMRVDENRDLVLSATGVEWREPRPVVYEEQNGFRMSVEGHYVTIGHHVIGFEVGPHDPARPLIIDSVLSFSTFLGGSNGDGASARLSTSRSVVEPTFWGPETLPGHSTTYWGLLSQPDK